LTRITIDIGKNFTVQNFTIFACFVTKIVSVDIIFLLFYSDSLGVFLFNTNNTVIGRIDAVIIIRGLLIGTTRSHKEGSDHQYGRGS